jgi:hypothetical protein
MTAWFKALFLFSSFGPLYFFLALGLAVQHRWQDRWNWDVGSRTMVVAATMLVFSYAVFLYLETRFAVGSVIRQRISAPERLDESVLSYMLSYLPPLMIDDFANAAKVVPAIGFYAVLITLMAVTNTIYVNPYFLVAGIRIWRVTLQDGKRVVLISKRGVLTNDALLPLYSVSPGSLYYVPKDDP